MGDRLWEKFSGVGNSLLHQPVKTQASALINIHAPMSVLLQSVLPTVKRFSCCWKATTSVGLCCAVETASLAIFFQSAFIIITTTRMEVVMILLNYMTPWQKTQRIVPPCIIIIFFNANIHTTQQGNQCGNNVDRRCACYWTQFPCCRINSIQCFCKKKVSKVIYNLVVFGKK